jgi:hypothetical protein
VRWKEILSISVPIISPILSISVPTISAITHVLQLTPTISTLPTSEGEC